jgi:hypothetical protein
MQEKNPIRKVREFLNSSPTEKQLRIAFAIAIATTALPLCYVAIQLLAK